MKNKIFLGVAVLAIATIAAINVDMSKSNNQLSMLSLANVEALATELPEVVVECSSAGCHGSACHNDTYNWICPCEANGDPYRYCLI